MKPHFIFKGLAFIASLVALAYLVRVSGLEHLLDQGWIDREVRGKGLSGDMIYLGAGAIATALGFPRQVIAFLGGYAFGLSWGTLLAALAAAAGCVLAFYYARLLGRSLVANRFPGRVRRLDEFLGTHPFSMALLLRLLPVGSNAVTNLVAGVSSVRPLPFVAGSTVGYLPQTLVFALAGSGIRLNPGLRIGLAVVLFLLSGLLGIYLYRRYRNQVDYEEGVVDTETGQAAEPGRPSS
jgi:uncharacterized membrane protein YdjX (TVP38/TMEM64 family)